MKRNKLIETEQRAVKRARRHGRPRSSATRRKALGDVDRVLLPWQSHVGSCNMEPVYCDNKCGSRVHRKHLAQHKSGECPKRLVSCRHCAKTSATTPCRYSLFFFLIHSARSAATLLETHTSMAGSAKSIGTTCQYRSMNFAYANVEQMVIVMAEK